MQPYGESWSTRDIVELVLFFLLLVSNVWDNCQRLMIWSKIDCRRFHGVTDQVRDPGGDGLAAVALVHARLRQKDARVPRIDRN